MPFKNCLVCYESVSVNHLKTHLKKHDLTVEEYYQYYLNTECEPVCVRGNKKTFNDIKLGYSKYCKANCECHVAATQKSNSEREPEYRRQVAIKGAQKRKERLQSDPIYAEETRQRNSELGRRMAAGYNKTEHNRESSRHARLLDWQNPEYRRKMSKIARQPKTYSLERLQALRANMRKIALRFNSTSKKRAQLSEAMSKRILNGNHPKPRFRGTRCPYKGEVFRSTWELRFAQALDAHYIGWQYEKLSLQYIDHQGVQRWYTPDFYIPALNIYVEIHPKDFWDDAMKSKVDAMKRSLNCKMFVIMSEKRLEGFARSLQMRIITDHMKSQCNAIHR